MGSVLDFLVQYWALILFLFGIVWAIVRLYFEFKYFKKDTVPQIFNEMKLLQQHLDKHDEADKLMAESLERLIDRNRKTTEDTSKEVQGRLTTIGEDLAVVKNNINLIISGKIKEK